MKRLRITVTDVRLAGPGADPFPWARSRPSMTPAQAQPLLQQGLAHHRAGRLDQAAALYRRVVGAMPRHFDATLLMGTLVLQQGRPREAVEWLTRAHQLDPRSPMAALRLGRALMAVSQPGRAETAFRTAVALKPDLAEAWDGLAYCLKLQDRFGEAVPCHEKAVAAQPDFAIGWCNFGLTLAVLGRQSEALACHERALQAQPDFVAASFGRAQALQQLDRLPEAIAAYDAYLAREPGHHEAHSCRLFALNNLDTLSREQLFAEHVAFGRRFSPAAALPASVPDPARRLRVAILSPDLRSHSCAYFLEPLLEHLDPAGFELYLYHDHFREDEVSARLRARAALWRNFVGQANAAVEPVIRADRPDILIDLAGHIGMTARLPLFARRLAPVQITYLGYPNTTGLTAMDYRFTDAIADPPGEADALATEQLVRFAPTAWAYRPLAHAPLVPPLPSADPARGITFGCFNNLSKVTDTTLRAWSRLLEQVPGSRLILKGRGLGEAAARAALTARLTACGLPPERVELLDRTATSEEHLGLYGRVDIALDTFPYGGTTTTCEALWMGRPVVTCCGDRHAARVGASLLTALGRPEWIAHNTDDYVRIAVALAADRAGLARLSTGLREEMARSPLCDHRGQSRRFAEALRACWTQRVTGSAAAPTAAG